MEGQDIKKLIISFLILAMAVSSLSFFFSSFSTDYSLESYSSQKKTENKEKGYPRNAFVESLPSDDLDWFFGEKSNGNYNRLSRRPTDNLTENLTQLLVQEVADANPQKLASGSLSLSEENIKNLVDKQIRNFELEKILPIILKKAEEKLKIKKNYDDVDIKKYSEDLSEGIKITVDDFYYRFSKLIEKAENNGNYINDNLYIDDNLKREFAAFVKSANANLEKGILKLEDAEVPELFVGLHKAILSYTKTTQVLVRIVKDYEYDPLKTVVALRDTSKIKSYRISQTRKIREEIDKLRKISLSENKNKITQSPLTKNLLLLKNLLLVEKALAAAGPSVPVGDILNTATHAENAGTNTAETSRSAWEMGVKIAIDALKNRLVHRMVQQIITWIQGGGKPQFITDWQGFLRGAANVAAGRAIEAFVPGLCKSFQPLIKINLQKTYLADAPTPTCTLDKVVNNLQDFYDDFRNGGWQGYGETILPDGNYFGSLIKGSILISQAAKTEKEAEKANAQSNQGFKGFKTCKNPKLREGFTQDAETEVKKDPDYIAGSWHCDSQGGCRAKFCEKNSDGTGNWEESTPGGVAASALYESLNAPLNQIISAQDFEALIAAIVNSAISKLMNSLSKDSNSGGLANLDTRAETATGNSTDPCTGLTGKELDDCLASSAVFDESEGGAPETAARNLLEEAKNELKYKKSEKDLLQVARAKASSTLDLISQIEQSNCSLNNDDSEYLNEIKNNIEQSIPLVDSRLSALLTLIPQLDDFIKNLESSINQGQLRASELSQKMEEFNNNFKDKGPFAIERAARAASLADEMDKYEKDVEGISQSCSQQSSPNP